MSFSIIFTKIISLFVALAALLGFNCGNITKPTQKTYPFVLVNGLMGWGQYEFYYDVFPYWGMMGGDMITKFNDKGYEAYAASVDGIGSTWDRACELYAQLTGSVVDYGKAHSEQYGHNRYGADYTDKRLIKNEWSADEKVNLFGHSFGGATIRMLTSLMEYGSSEEQSATNDGTLSELFTGGKGDWVNCVYTLSAPHNGSSSYEADDFAEDDGTPLAKIKLLYDKLDPTGFIFNYMVGMCSDSDGNIKPDTAHWELRIDNALKLNESIKTVPGVYYFSVATTCTTKQDDGTYAPKACEMEPLFFNRSIGIGKNTFVTDGGFVVDESWQENDGLVSVKSARYPFNEAHTDYSFDAGYMPQKGIWNVMPDFYGDHTAFMGDIILTKDNSSYFYSAFDMINSLS